MLSIIDVINCSMITTAFDDRWHDLNKLLFGSRVNNINDKNLSSRDIITTNEIDPIT